MEPKNSKKMPEQLFLVRMTLMFTLNAFTPPKLSQALVLIESWVNSSRNTTIVLSTWAAQHGDHTKPFSKTAAWRLENIGTMTLKPRALIWRVSWPIWVKLQKEQLLCFLPVPTILLALIQHSNNGKILLKSWESRSNYHSSTPPTRVSSVKIPSRMVLEWCTFYTMDSAWSYLNPSKKWWVSMVKELEPFTWFYQNQK